MNPGKLTRRLTIQTRAITKDSTGSRVETWTDSAQTWAELRRQSGSVSVIADSDRDQDTKIFKIRWREISPTENRIKHKGIIYQITGLSEDGVKTFITIDTVSIKGGN